MTAVRSMALAGPMRLAGGTISVPGGTGAGEFPGATSPPPARWVLMRGIAAEISASVRKGIAVTGAHGPAPRRFGSRPAW